VEYPKLSRSVNIFIVPLITMRNFEFGITVRAFAKLGNQREAHWKDAMYLGNNTVEFRQGTVLILKDEEIKRIKKLDCVDGEWPALKEFVDNNWESLKSVVVDAMGKFFPEVVYTFDEKEHIVKANHFFISPAVVEFESWDAFTEQTVWQLSAEMYRAGSYWEPPDVDIADMDCGKNSDFIVRKLLDAIWNDKTEAYWENKWCETL
jgi:hypothetical protein